MDKEIITKKQFIAIMIAFLIGSSMVLGVAGEAQRDAWISVLIAMVMSVPVFFVYSRIVSLFPGKGLYEILTTVFGKTLGKIISIPLIWYTFHLGALVIRNFTEFISIVTLSETPQYVIAMLMIILSIWIVKAGIEVIGRWSAIVVPILLWAIVLVTLLFIPELEFGNIKPILYDGLKPVLSAAFAVFAFPFAEVVILIAVFDNLKKGDSPYKVFYWGLLIGGINLAMITLRSLLALGLPTISITYFPAYASVRLINIADFIERIEVTVAISFMLGGFVKVSMCLLVASRGISKVLNLKSYRPIVAPVGLLMMILSLIIYSSAMEMFEWVEKYYKYYAILFQIIFPIMIWIGAEIKARKRRNGKMARG